MEKYALGRNQTAIARDENLNRESVGRIVKSAEMEAFRKKFGKAGVDCVKTRFSQFAA